MDMRFGTSDWRRGLKLPRVEAGARSVELRASELAMVLDGIDVSKLKRVPRYERRAVEPQRDNREKTAV